MKTIGVVGGIGPESTLEYYRQMIAAYRAQVADGSYPLILIHSINLQQMVNLFTAGRHAEATDVLADSLQRLARAGADFALMAANTPHLLFDAIRARSPIPLLSIVEVTRAAAQARGFHRLALFGSRFTMQGRIYADTFAAAGIAVVSPQPAEQDYIHEKYMGELVLGNILPETRRELLAIVERMRTRDQIDGLILGGTELPLILHDGMAEGVPFLDTTEIHVRAAIAQLLA